MTDQVPAADLLTVSDLRVEFARRRRTPLVAVNGVSFTIGAHETVAIVGESGSGKTTIGRAILGMIQPQAGSIRVNGSETVRLRHRERRALTQKLQVVFQDPYGSLNPALTIGAILTEPLRIHHDLSREAARERIAELLRRVGLPPDAASRYPAHFSGGQRQRIAIARALSVSPQLVICDEPTSALDVSTQAQVLELLTGLQQDTGLAYLFITHDLAVVRHFAQRVLVLRSGEVVEEGTAAQICESPQHSYTRALVAAAPVPDPVLQRARREAARAAHAA